MRWSATKRPAGGSPAKCRQSKGLKVAPALCRSFRFLFELGRLLPQSAQPAVLPPLAFKNGTPASGALSLNYFVILAAVMAEQKSSTD